MCIRDRYYRCSSAGVSRALNNVSSRPAASVIDDRSLSAIQQPAVADWVYRPQWPDVPDRALERRQVRERGSSSALAMGCGHDVLLAVWRGGIRRERRKGAKVSLADIGVCSFVFFCPSSGPRPRQPNGGRHCPLAYSCLPFRPSPTPRCSTLPV